MNNQLSNNFSLPEATRQIVELKENMGKSVIALGNWLMLVKENLPRGEYMNFLKYEVKISQSQAWRFMKVAREVDYQTLEKVGYRKMTEILELPESKFREELIEAAPNLSKATIEGIVSQAKEEMHSPGNDAVEQVTLSTVDADTAIDANATLLDALARIKIEAIPKDYVDFLTRQLKSTPEQLEEFLQKIKEK